MFMDQMVLVFCIKVQYGFGLCNKWHTSVTCDPAPLVPGRVTAYACVTCHLAAASHDANPYTKQYDGTPTPYTLHPNAPFP
jgi:hypothetical protein